MKKLSTLPIWLLFCFALYGQTPNKLNFQATVRNASNNLIANQQVGVRLILFQGSVMPANNVFSERHTPTTNTNGLFSIEVGGG